MSENSDCGKTPPVNGERAVRLFCSLAEIDNPSRGEAAMSARVAAECEALGLAPKTDSAGNITVHIAGTLPGEPICFSAHLDAVSPAVGKRAIRHPDGRITSAGDTVLAADDLTGIAEILEAVRALGESHEPHRELELIFPVCEELYTVGSREMDYIGIKSRQAYVLDLSGPVGRAAIAAPTILYLKITVNGKASHAGFAPEAGIHAIQAAAKAIAKCRFGHVDADTTVGIGIIKGGEASNIVPGKCCIEGEIRGYNDGRVAEEAAKLRSLFETEAKEIGASVEWYEEKRTQAYSVSENSAAAKRFIRACGSVGVKHEFIRTFGGSDANTFALKGMDCLVIANAMNNIHTTAEYTTAGEIARVTEIVYRLMTDAD